MQPGTKMIIGRVVNFRPLRFAKRVLVDWLGLSICDCIEANRQPDTGAWCHDCPEPTFPLAGVLAKRVRDARDAAWRLRHPDPTVAWTDQMRADRKALDATPVILRIGRKEAARFHSEQIAQQQLDWLAKHGHCSIEVLSDERSHLEAVLGTPPAAVSSEHGWDEENPACSST